MTSCEHSDQEAASCRALEDAAEEQQVVTFRYKKADGSVSTRMLSPYEVTGDITESNLKVLGWDHERQALRSFNLDWAKLSDVTIQPDTEYVPPSS